MKRNSIFLKLLGMFIVFALIIIGILWTMQSFFLNDFYQRQKINQMKNYGKSVETKINENGLTDETLKSMDEIAQQINGRISIIDNNGAISLQQVCLDGPAHSEKGSI